MNKKTLKIKLNEEDVTRIRKLGENGSSASELAEMYNVDSSTISQVLDYGTWRHVDPVAAAKALKTMPKSKSRRRKTTPEMVLDIVTSPLTNKELAQMHKISAIMVSHIRCGRYHRDVIILENKNESIAFQN